MAPPAIAPEDFVQALYRTYLGRPADPAGLAYWAELIRSTGDPTSLLQGILHSDEYRERGADQDCTAEIKQALAGIQRRLRIVDVGAQALGAGSHAYEGLLNVCDDAEIIGFDPLEERLQERARTEPGHRLTLLPYATGDGGTYTLYIANEDSNSSLFPLNEPHNARFNHIGQLRVVQTTRVKTHRLDDVLPEGPVDFLKLDVQGAELMTLQGAERVLSETAVVHCEVMFSPMYIGEPLFCDIQRHLISRKFELIDLIVSTRYHYLTPSRRTTPDRLLWADAVFFRETSNSETRRVQALIAASVYRKPTLAEYLLLE